MCEHPHQSGALRIVGDRILAYIACDDCHRLIRPLPAQTEDANAQREAAAAVAA